MRENVYIETVVILNYFTGFLKNVDAQINDPILWPELSQRIRKYSELYNMPPNKVEALRKITIDTFA